MSVATRGTLGRALHKISGWLSANWVEPKLSAEAAPVPAVISKAMFLGSQAALPTPALSGKPFLEQYATATAAPTVACTAATAQAVSAATIAELAERTTEVQPTAVTAPAARPTGYPKDFRLASRLSAVSQLNAPASRASRRGQPAIPAGRAMPLVKTPDVKIAKDTRLPTAFAARTLKKKAKPSAEIIELSAAKSRMRHGSARRAA